MTNEELGQIQREVTHKNKASALVVLNTLTIKEGEILKIKYYTSSGQEDSLVAIGIGNGVGPSYYTLVSDQSIPLITSILDYRPDVSDMVSGAIYLFNDSASNNYFKYYHLNGDLIEEEITENFYFTNLEDMKYYYFDSTKGAQKIINVSTNLSDKASFQGIVNVSKERYQELLDSNQIVDDMVYLVNDGVNVTGLFYNYMPFEFDVDPGGEIKNRIDTLEAKVDRSIIWIDD